MRPHGIMFHHFHNAHHPRGQGSISAGQLRQIIRFIVPDRFLPAREFLARAAEGAPRPTDLCLTFDDNLRCQYDIAVPVLREFGLTAFFFIYTAVLQGTVEPLEIYRHFRMTHFNSVDDFYDAFLRQVARSPWSEMLSKALSAFVPATYLAEFPFYTGRDREFRFIRDEVLGPARYKEMMNSMLAGARVDQNLIAKDLWMDDACLRELHQEGHVIGLHSHTHPTRIERLNHGNQRHEYESNVNYLHKLLGERPTSMSHPCNSYNQTTLEILDDLGIRVGFRANMSLSKHRTLEIPREDHANILSTMERAA